VHVFVHSPAGHPPSVYVSSRFFARWVAEAYADTADAAAREIKHPRCVVRVVQGGARDLQWLQLSPEASAAYLDLRRVAPAPPSTPPPAAPRTTGRAVVIHVLALWQQKAALEDAATAPHRDPQGAIVLSRGLLEQARQDPRVDAAGLTATALATQLRAAGVDAASRDGGLRLSVTEIPKPLRASP
jgi:hypothetical protein